MLIVFPPVLLLLPPLSLLLAMLVLTSRAMDLEIRELIVAVPRWGGRVLAISFSCGDGDRLLISGALRIIGSNPKGILASSGFGGGRTPLGSDPRSKLPLAALWHFDI